MNNFLTDIVGREVLMVDAIPATSGDRVEICFTSVGVSLRQGVRIATAGALFVNDVESPQLDLWTDTSPGEVLVDIRLTDGLLRVYNIWQSDGYPGSESRADTSGMLVDVEDDWRVYRCHAFGRHPSFDDIVFRLRVIRTDDET